MYELTGYLGHINVSYQSGLPLLSFEIDNKQAGFQVAEKLLGAGRLTIKVDKYREKRSLDANAYLWKLCSLIADKLSEDGSPETKESIYQSAIKAKGIYREQGELPLDFAKTSRHAWEMLGTGWVTEQVDFEPDGDKVIVRYYYGSSTYNSKQMSRVIDWLVTECHQLDIPTKSQEELNSLLNSWGSKK